MDSFVKNKLEERGLMEWSSAFEENFIDQESFLLLDSETLKELIKPLGPRMKAARQIKELKQFECNEVNDSPGMDPPTTPVSEGTAIPVSHSSDAPSQEGENVQFEGAASSSTPKRQKLFFDVRQILKNHPDGRTIESEMDDGLLSSKSRIKAVRIFVSHLMEKHGDRPKSHIKEALARSIIVQFPKLKGDGNGYEAWYTPSIAQHAATGYLEERLRNVRKRTAKKHQPSSHQHTSELNRSTASSASSIDSDEEAIDPAEVEAMSQWLKHNKEPLSQVREYHRKTAHTRLSWIKNNPDKPVKELFLLYPRLLDTPGLISIDFAVLKPGTEDCLFHLWTPGLAKNILQYADKQNDWSRHLDVQLDNNNDDEVCNIALQCLPCIFPTGSHKIKGKSRRATINEAISSFVDARKVGTNIPSYLENVTNKQPFVLILGGRVNPDQVFVIIEREAIPQDSLLKAIDLCFKCFYVYDIDYPWQTSNSWQFLQSAIYNIEEGVSCNTLNCSEPTEVCVEGGNGATCECAENYIVDDSGSCRAVSCLNSASSCNTTTERCENNSPGIRCVCAENYFEDLNGECTAVSCLNSANICNKTTERCENTNPGVRCVCAENYFEDFNGECTAASCLNSANKCNEERERCENTNPGIKCVCAENYFEDSNGECTAISCLNTDHMCYPAKELCEDLNPGIRCICAEGYTKSIEDNCRPISTEMTGNDVTTEPSTTYTECPSGVIEIGGISLSFPLTRSGEKVNSLEKCNVQLSQNQTLSIATRLCSDGWQEPVLQNCFDVDTLEKQLDILLQLRITDENVDELSRSFALLTYQANDITVQLLETIIKYLRRIVSLDSPSFEVTDAVVAIVSIIIQVREEILNQTEGVSSVIPLLEEQMSTVHKSGLNYSQIQPDIEVRALQVPKLSLKGDLTFVSYRTYKTEQTYDEKSVQEASITVPSSVLPLVEKVYTDISTVPISFVTYQDPKLFRKDENNTSDVINVTEYIGSDIVSITVELPNVTIRDLPQNSSVLISFSDLMLNGRKNATRLEAVCVYWERTLESGEGVWSQTGCNKLSTGFENITCSCNHLTSFAVLVRTYDEEETDVHLALQLISVIGCIISVIGLSISLVCMVVLRSVRIKQQTHVHFNLCLALLGLYLSFLFGIGQAEQPEMCRGMTSVIYFFCLSSMAWMSVEAFYIYMLIWKYKQHNIKHLIPVGVMFAWGIPGVAAVVVYFLDNTHDYEAERDYCFLHPGYVLLYGFLLELFILFLYNTIVFVLVTYRIYRRKIKVWNKEDRRQELSVRLKSTLLFWLLLGISWIFGFLATFEYSANIVFQIIFCLLISLKGFFMFYMLIVQNPEMKKSLSSVSTLRIQSASLQLGARSSAAISTKKQSRQELSPSVDHIYDSKTYV